MHIEFTSSVQATLIIVILYLPISTIKQCLNRGCKCVISRFINDDYLHMPEGIRVWRLTLS